MPEFTKHDQGTFCWVEHSSPNQDAAKKFYTGVFGWDVEDIPISDGDVYSMFRVGGKDVAATYKQSQDEKGVPPHWNTYVAVDDADVMAKTAESLGGTVVAPPFDVMDSGRMAVIQDPSGGILGLWQGKSHIGARLMNEPNTLTWNELQTRDTDSAKTFLTQLFGWTTEEVDAGEGRTYFVFNLGDRQVGGLFGMGVETPPEVPPYYNVCFGVENADATVAKAKDLGANVLLEPIDSQWGRYSVLMDDQGATFSIIQSPWNQPPQ